MKIELFLLCSILSLVSCAPHGSTRNPDGLKPEARQKVFADLLKQNASRIDVEVIAALGKDHMASEHFDEPKQRQAAINSITISGKYTGSPYGNKVYRVTNVSQAKGHLARTWPMMDFSADSEVGLLFQKHPRASVAFMECDNTRIFFFDKNDRLVAVYPEAGGGC